MSWLYLLLLVLLVTISNSTPLTEIYVSSSSPNATNSSSCGAITSPCVTFDDGMNVVQSMFDRMLYKGISLQVAEGEYSYYGITNFKGVSDLSIIGQTNHGTVILTTVNCVGNSGFRFIKSFNIKLYGISFIGCGQLQSSTSYDQTDSDFPLFYVGLYFLYCRDVNLTLVSVSNSQATGIVLYNIIGTNILNYLTVTNNTFNQDEDSGYSSGGGVYIEYSYCVPDYDKPADCLSNGIANVNDSYTYDSNFVITNSNFTDNIANTSNFNDDTFILPHKQYHTAFGRGGGLSVFFKGSASNNFVFVEGCVFENNRALWGGGLFVEFQDTSFRNSVTIKSSRLKNNSLYFNDTINEGTGGGGARVGYVFYGNNSVYSNNITFASCTFENNSAYYGGGLSFYSARQLLMSGQTLNTLELHGCNFTDNVARIGAGIDLSLWHPSITGKHPHPLISNCLFQSNYPLSQNTSGIVGVGAVYIDSLPVTFKGNVTFDSNTGSALAVTGNYISIDTNSTLYFRNNTGRNGGAIALLGDTFILTNEHSLLKFVNNSAQYKGGAIYSYRSGERDLLSSRNCFIRYHDITVTPNNWTASFKFTNNTIRSQRTHDNKPVYNSIYTTSLLPCMWGGAKGNSLYQNVSNSKVFCWKTWYFETSEGYLSPCYDHISSSPTTYHNMTYHYSTKSGKSLKLNLTVTDELGNDVTDTAIFIARIMNGSSNTKFRGVDKTLFNYISHEYLDIIGAPDTTVDVLLETLDPVVTRNVIKVYFESCPPGFMTTDTTGCTCVSPRTFDGYVQCNDATSTSHILRMGWVGKPTFGNPDEFFVGESPYLYKDTTHRYIQLNNGSLEYLNKIFCKSASRTDTLCGSCQNGTSVAVTSDTYDCVKCDDKYQRHTWVYYLLSTYLPITIFFIVVLIFSTTVTFGPLNAFIFFAQVVTTAIKVDADGMIPLQNVTQPVSYNTLKYLYIIPYGFWNIDFFRPLLGKFCLSPRFNTLDVILLGYGEAFYPLILLLLMVPILILYNKGYRCVVFCFRPFHRCLARFQQVTNLRQSVTGGIAVFIVMSYTKFTLISILLLTPTLLKNSDGSQIIKVHYYDGTFLFPEIKYVIPAVFVLIIFSLIPPLLLVYPSLLRLIERLSCWRIKLTKLYPPLKLKIFLDEFHGCYKDGTNKRLDCRWFAGLYFFLRLALFLMYSYIAEWQSQYIAQTLLFLLIALLFAVIRPYQKDWVNNVDIICFLLLASISALSLYNLMQTWLGEKLGRYIFIVQYILILIPLFYCIIYYLVYFCKRCAYLPIKKRISQRNIQEEPQQQDAFSYQDALVNSDHVPDILHYIEPSTRVRLSDSVTWRQQLLDSQRAPLLTPQSSANKYGSGATPNYETASSNNTTE